MSQPSILAASILSADFANLGSSIKEAEDAGVDWVHIDVMDGHFVPNITMGPIVVEACKRATDLPLDVHLMVTHPEDHIQQFHDAGADSITIHVESNPNYYRTLQVINEHGLKAGVALNPGSPLELIQEVVALVDMVLIMTVHPGSSGQSFIHRSLGKLKALREIRSTAELNFLVQVDGGITVDTGPAAREAGADVFVAASSIFASAAGISSSVQDLQMALGSTP